MKLNRRSFLGVAAAAPVAAGQMAQEVASGATSNIASAAGWMGKDVPSIQMRPEVETRLKDTLRYMAERAVDETTGPWSDLNHDRSKIQDAAVDALKSVAPWRKQQLKAQANGRARHRAFIEQSKLDFLPGYRAKRVSEAFVKIAKDFSSFDLDQPRIPHDHNPDGGF